MNFDDLFSDVSKDWKSNSYVRDFSQQPPKEYTYVGNGVFYYKEPEFHPRTVTEKFVEITFSCQQEFSILGTIDRAIRKLVNIMRKDVEVVSDHDFYVDSTTYRFAKKLSPSDPNKITERVLTKQEVTVCTYSSTPKPPAS